MKHICFFSGDITRGGGTERVATAVANGLARLGKYKVSFLSLVQQRDRARDPVRSLNAKREMGKARPRVLTVPPEAAPVPQNPAGRRGR